VQSAVEQATPAARRRGVDLKLTLPDAPLRIRHDPQRVGQVVGNLVGNAIKFTPTGGSVEVVVSPHVDGARIDVNDTGTGIDASELPRIFDRFYRGSLANEARGSGSGLGLAIVRSIVDMHGGSVTVDSRLGSGSSFSVFLPRDPRVEDPRPPPRPIGRDEGAGSGKPPPKVADSSPTTAPALNRESSG
jgi:signal transduction histidine kinase